jgi:hypothetical protein
MLSNQGGATLLRVSDENSNQEKSRLNVVKPFASKDFSHMHSETLYSKGFRERAAFV